MRARGAFIAFMVGASIALPQAAVAQEAKQPTATGSGGAAATVDLDGTRAAIETLRRGGNAVDAAVAAAAVLGVTEPFSCGIGGGGFMVIRTPGGKVTTIDSREEATAPDVARLVHGERGATGFQRGALQRPVGRRSGNGRRVESRASPLRHLVASRA